MSDNHGNEPFFISVIEGFARILWKIFVYILWVVFKSIAALASIVEKFLEKNNH